jgi:hypothetical protein
MLQPSIYTQLFSTLGAVLCLIAYAGHQLKWIEPRNILYNLLNVAGSGILVYIAFRPLQVGFFLMEAVWVALSVFALCKAIVKMKRV